ncbi:hypothetical protein KR222_011449, partial [Zaprionus bogoriensis]
KLLLLGLLALQQLEIATASRILAPFIYPGKSHFMMTKAIIEELVQRGHEVTFITPFSLEKEQLGANYTEILIPQYNFWPSLLKMSQAKSALDMTDISTQTFIKMSYVMGLESTEFAFEQPEVLKLIQAKDKVGKYDLLLAEQFSVYHSFFEELLRTFWYYPAQDAILQKHFANQIPNLPSAKQLERNISAILLNTYMPLEAPRPISFNMIPVGGLHIQPEKPLPKALQSFLDEAEHGVIYFSLGSQVRSADLPPEKLKIFLNVFRSLKQRILWKFEDDKLPNLPANVMVRSWMPQNDILAHPNVKVFISHGGTQEAVHHGVPVLGMPIYGDQYLNINKAKAAGFALRVDYRAFTEEELRYSLTELLENPKYMDNMKSTSRVYRHRPLNAMDTAMFWIDYIIEHRGAPHMVSAGLDLTWYQFYLLDIIALVLAVILLPVLGLILVCRKGKSVKTAKSKPKAKRN